MGEVRENSLRRRIHELLAPADWRSDKASRVVDYVLLTLILANVVAFVLESMEPLRERWQAAFTTFEAVSVAVFTLEYVLRIWSCVEVEEGPGFVRGRLRHAFRPLMIIDLLAILPFYLPLIGLDLRVLRVLRLFRVVRLFKLARYSRALQVLGRAVVQQRYELISTVSIVLLLELVAASLMYHAESSVQPEAFSSVPSAAWWAIATLTTVGYGDVTPVTPAGKAIAAFVALLGVLVIALPTAILGAAFVDELQQERREATPCPHCGKTPD